MTFSVVAVRFFICGLVAEGSENSGQRNQSELDENIPPVLSYLGTMSVFVTDMHTMSKRPK